MHLGLTGCTKLVAMITVVALVGAYGADWVLNIFGNGARVWIPVKLAIAIPVIPALLAACLVAKCLDVLFRTIEGVIGFEDVE